jgi:integrase/recombinase XerD
MILSLSIRFYLNANKAKGDKSPIYLRVTVDRKKAEIATKYSIEAKDWDDTKQRTKKNVQINEDLSGIESDVYSIAKRLEKEKKLLSANAIKDILTHKDCLDAYLLEYYDKYIQRLEKAGEVEKVTITRYNETKKYLTQFLNARKLNDILIENIDFKFLLDLDLFLLNVKVTDGGQPLERNTINKHHSRVRTILIRAIKEGFIHKNPYSDFQLKNTAPKRTFLSQEELDSIINHDLGGNDSLIRVRDIFVFSVYTGLRFEDAQRLTADKIIIDKNGKTSLEIQQEKTGEPLCIPILKPALKIIDKYTNSPERLLTGKILPKISNQKLNTYLKVIADMAKIRKVLSHHVARHTCATTVLLSNEVPLEVVSKWLGHRNIRTTQIYAKITNNYMQKMAEKIDLTFLSS